MDLIAALLPVFIICLQLHASAGLRCTDKWNIYACYGGNKRSMPSDSEIADKPKVETPNLLRELLLRLRQVDSEQDQLPVAAPRSHDVIVPPVDREPFPDSLAGRNVGARADEETRDESKNIQEWDSRKDRFWKNDWRDEETAGVTEEKVDATRKSNDDDDDDAMLSRLLRKWLNEIRTEQSRGDDRLLESDNRNS